MARTFQATDAYCDPDCFSYIKPGKLKCILITFVITYITRYKFWVSFVICVSILLAYSLTELGQTCDDIGLSLITDRKECIIAIESFGRTYDGDQNVEFFPKGCYVWVHRVSKVGYLNKHKTGRAHKQAKAICKGK